MITHVFVQVVVTLSVAALLGSKKAKVLDISLSGWAAGVACAELAEAGGLAGASAVSAAQAGTTTKVNNNSSIFFTFMVTLPLWLKK